MCASEDNSIIVRVMHANKAGHRMTHKYVMHVEGVSYHVMSYTFPTRQPKSCSTSYFGATTPTPRTVVQMISSILRKKAIAADIS